MIEKIVARSPRLQRDISASVEAMDFALRYQPIVQAETGDVVNVEALLRWTPPGRAMRMPELFLPHLEATGLINSVGVWVVEEACRQLAAWRSESPAAADLSMSVNISRVQFGSPTLVGDISRCVATYGLEPSSLTLEITESAFSSARLDIARTLIALRRRGFQIAIDDFGVGQSSLSALCDLPIQVVKIDRSFVAAPRGPSYGALADRVAAREHVLRSIILLARNLGLKTTVEGIESKAQHDRLRAMGCDMMQGFWQSRPVHASLIPALL